MSATTSASTTTCAALGFEPLASLTPIPDPPAGWPARA